MRGLERQPAFAAALRLLGRAIVALDPYVDDLIVIGGMAPVLWAHSPELRDDALPHVGTTEIDISVPRRLRRRELGVKEALEAADFVAIERGGYRDEPGVVSFQDKNTTEKNRLAPTYVEFLAPLTGRGDRGVVAVQQDLRAEALRYLDLLAFEPLTLELAAVQDLGLTVNARVRVPQPCMYVAQKVLARSSGRLARPEKAAKDLAYTFHAARVSRQHWNAQAEIVARAAKEAPVWETWLTRAGRHLRELFATTSSDGPVEAGRIYRDLMGDDAPRDEEIAQVVSKFVETVFRPK